MRRKLSYKLTSSFLLHVTGVFITLQFEEFILQDSYKCTADFLEIREFNETGLLIGQFCGVGRIPPIESLNTLWLNFHSNWVLEKSGFVIQYYLRGRTGCLICTAYLL